MLCCVKFSAQSLEAIASIVAESAGRISELCMHVGMQIYCSSVYYTSPSSHRRFPPRLNYSPPCSKALGAMITPTAPPIPHSKTLDNFCVQFLQLFTGCSSSLERPALSSLCCHLWTSSETNLSQARSQTPRHYAPPTVTAWSHSFWRLLQLLRCILGTCRLPYTV